MTTPYDRPWENLLAAIELASARIWIRNDESTP